MDISTSLAAVAFAALIHASFQLSVSVLTLMSGHAIGAKRTQAKVMRLTTGFIFGVAVMTMLVLSFVALVLLHVFGADTPKIVWAAGCGLLVGVAVAIWAFYYPHKKGTILWIPRGVADYLTKRTKATKDSAEAFGLGLSSVLAELLFLIAPIVISAIILIQLPPLWQLAGIGIYTVISLLSLIIVWVLIGSGHTLAGIQKWREENKRFLQFAAGLGLVVLGFYVYVGEIMNVTAGGI